MIREANKFDMDDLIDMIKRFSDEGPVTCLSLYRNEAHVRQLFNEIIAGRGLILIEPSEGFIAAVISPSIWNPKILQLSELAWWVVPDKREGTLGGRLFIEYNRRAQEMINQGRVEFYTCSLMSTSPRIDLEKRGLKRMEETYFKEAT